VAPPNAFRWLSPATNWDKNGGVRTSDMTVVNLQNITIGNHYRNKLELVAWDANSGVRLAHGRATVSTRLGFVRSIGS
jgi:hypothetical protein